MYLGLLAGSHSVFAQAFGSLQASFRALGYEPALTYLNDYEAATYAAWQEGGQLDRQRMLLATDPSMTASKAADCMAKWQEVLQWLDDKGLEGRPLRKQVGLIRKRLRKRLLRAYAPAAQVSDAFADGTYSHLSGTALLALAFDHYGIPYQIWADAATAMVVADPFRKFGPPVEIEPGSQENPGRFFPVNQQVAYLQFLAYSGGIDPKTAHDRSVDEAFYDYYLPMEDLFFHELIGMIYLQQGMLGIRRQQFDRAAHQLEKAFLFRPSYAVKYQLYRTKLRAHQDATYADWAELQELMQLYQLLPGEELRGVVRQAFVTISAEYLLRRDSLDYYQEVYLGLTSQLEDSLLSRQLTAIYVQQRANHAAQQEQYEDALQWMAKLEMPDSIADVQMRVSLFMGKRLARLTSCEEREAFIDQQLKAFPFLVEQKDLARTAFSCKSELARKWTKQQAFGQARQKLEEALAFASPEDDFLLKQPTFVQALEEVLGHLLANGQAEAARKLMDRSLRAFDNHADLVRIKNALKLP